MGAIVGACCALGVLLVLASLGHDGHHGSGRAKVRSVDRLAQQSGIAQLTGSRLVAICLAVGLVSVALTLLVTALPVVSLLSGIATAFVPIALIRRSARIRRRELRKVWPDAIDALLASVRGGYSLAESLCALADQGPNALRPAFAHFAGNYRVAGSFEESLHVLDDELADPVADRVVASLLIAHHVGGRDLGTVLRTLSALLREDARLRGELEARQSWTINAARLAVAAPWLTLLLLSTRPAALQAYRSLEGAVVLLCAAVLSVLAYRVMIWIGRLPDERRLADA